MEAVRITLLTRSGCHLCEFAREAVARVHAATGAGWVEVDVDTDPELQRDYGGRVPVVLLDGAEHDYFRVDEERLRRALESGADHPAAG
jgi:glutaredoxin